MDGTQQKQGPQLDPLVKQALHLLDTPAVPATAPAGLVSDSLPAPSGRLAAFRQAIMRTLFPARGRRRATLDWLSDHLASRIRTESPWLGPGLDSGLWARPVSKAAAKAALRVRAVAVNASDMP